MKELLEVKEQLQAYYRGAELTLMRDGCAIPREIILEDMKQYKEEIEIIERAIEILKRASK